MTVTRLVAGTLLVLLVAAGAQAQPAPWQPERLTAGWTFTPALGLGTMWDSNSTLRVTGDPAIAQWVALISPRGELDFNGRRTRMSAGYSGSLQAYRELDELTRYEQNARLQIRHQISPRVGTSLTGSLQMAPTTERIELGTLPYENVGSTLLNGRAAADYALTRRISFTGALDYQGVQFKEPLSGATNQPTALRGGYSNGISVTGKVALTSRFWSGANYGYRRANTDGGAQIVDILDGMVMLGVRLGEHTSAEAGAGYSSLRITNALAPDSPVARTGPSYRASLNHSYNRARFDIAYDRQYVPSWSFGGTTTNQMVRGGVSLPLGNGRTMLGANLTYSHNQPLLALNTSLELDTWSTGASIGYAIARWLRVEGFYNGNFQNSSAEGEINRTRIGVQFITLKPVRIQ